MNKSKSRILIVDDESCIRKVLKQILKKEGYKVFEAKDGISAYEKLKQGNYDLCFLDIQMPGQTGLEILNKIKQEKEINTKFIIITGNVDELTQTMAQESGADFYLKKPFELSDIKKAVKKVLKNN